MYQVQIRGLGIVFISACVTAVSFFSAAKTGWPITTAIIKRTCFMPQSHAGLRDDLATPHCYRLATLLAYVAISWM